MVAPVSGLEPLTKRPKLKDLPALVQQPTPTAPELVKRWARARKLCLADIESIAELVGMGLTEKEACLHLNIKPKTWDQWRTRNGNLKEFDEAVTRVKANTLVSSINFVKRFQPVDWRAAKQIAEWTAPERFSDRRDVNVAVTHGVSPNMSALIAKVFGAATPAQAVIDCEAQTTQALPSPTTPCAEVVQAQSEATPGRDQAPS